MSASLAQVAQILAQDSQEGGASILAFLFPFLILGGLFYIFILLPQRRRQKHAKEMQESMAIGDEVRTIGGIVGTIVGDEGDIFVLDLGGSTMRIVKRAVAERLTGDTPAAGDDA